MQLIIVTGMSGGGKAVVVRRGQAHRHPPA